MRFRASLLSLAACLLFSAAPAPAEDCSRPDAEARVIKPVMPEVPPMAQQQGIGGRVEVIVSLDAQSHVVATKIRRSASAILNPSAIAAARTSTYQTRVVNCVPVAADYIFSVMYAQR